MTETIKDLENINIHYYGMNLSHNGCKHAKAKISNDTSQTEMVKQNENLVGK